MSEQARESVKNYYSEQYSEDTRLLSDHGQLEFLRTQVLLERFLPPSPSTIADIGGASGRYAFWLASRGYRVHLSDIVPRHIEQALSSPDASHLASAKVGDARKLDFSEESIDVALLLGPLYHLTEREDRITALREAYRVIKPRGLVFAVGISRYASLLDGLSRGLLLDPTFREIVCQDLKDGQHRNPTDNPEYFTTAFLHRPEDLKEEVLSAGFRLKAALPIEGPAWLTSHLSEFMNNADLRKELFSLIQSVEDANDLLGLSAHFMLVGEK